MIPAWIFGLWTLWQPTPQPCQIDARVVWSSPVRPNALILICYLGECGDDAPRYEADTSIWVTPTTGSGCEECPGRSFYGCAYGNPGDHVVKVTAPDGTSVDLPVRLYLQR